MELDQDNQPDAVTNGVTLSRKAWTAYVSIVVRALILLGLGITAVYWQPDYWQITALVLLIGLTLIAYKIMLLRSVRLYYSDSGVWVYAGILPWKRGVSGVKWRDLDEALFENSFLSWISHSYTVQLKHRFTKAIEIEATSMSNGKQAVVIINQQHQQYIRAEQSTYISSQD